MFKVIEVPSEIGAGTRGASLGVAALKVSAWNSKSQILQGVPNVEVETHNEMLWSAYKNDNAKRLGGVLKVCEALAKEVHNAAANGFFPVVIGGDHSIGAGTIAGVKAMYPNKRVGVIWIDAHADLHTPFTTPSGNVHGMPLAASIGTRNEDCKNNDPTEMEIDLWERFSSMSGIKNKLDPKDLVFIALRDTEKEEEILIDKHGMKVIRVAEVNEGGVENAVESAIRHLGDCDIIHLSFDVDSMDTSISMGTGTPVDNGLSLEQAKSLVGQLMQHERIACFEMVEVNPTLDTKNKMADGALAVLEAAIGGLNKR